MIDSKPIIVRIVFIFICFFMVATSAPIGWYWYTVVVKYIVTLCDIVPRQYLFVFKMVYEWINAFWSPSSINL